MNKPRINYVDVAPPLVLGQTARLLLTDRKWYRTSPVVDTTYTTKGPIIETKNTFYWPGETDESMPVASIPRRAPVAVIGVPYRYPGESHEP